MINKKSVICRATEVGLLFVIGLYILTIDITKTTLKLGLAANKEAYFIWILSGLTVIRLAALLIEEKEKRKYWIRYIICALALGVVYLRIYQEVSSKSLLTLALITLGTIGMDYMKILKAYVIGAAAALFPAIFLSWTGAISNFVYVRDMTIRSSWGIKYPTDLMSLLFFFLLAVWVMYGRKGGLSFLVPAGLLMLISCNVADSRTGMMCGAAFMAAVCIEQLLKHRELKKFSKIIKILSCAAFPFFTIVMNVLVFAYKGGNPIALRINSAMSNRLSLSVDALNEYGITLWGSPLEQVGWGGSVFARPGYNFVDISYVLLLLKYGIVAVIIINILWVLMTRKAFKIGDSRLALALSLIAVNCIAEHHIIQINYDIFAAMPFSILALQAKDTKAAPDSAIEKGCQVNDLKYKSIQAAVVTLLAALTTAAILIMLPTIRTLMGLANIEEGSTRRRLIYLVAVIGIFISTKILKCAYNLVIGLIYKDNRNRKAYIAMVTAYVALVCIVIVGSNMLIDRKAEDGKMAVIRSEKDIIQTVLTSKSGKLYAYGLPRLYQKEYGGFSSSLFYGEELGRYRSTSVIMDRNLDTPCLFNTGFLYTPISEEHALYTNDEPVIRALQDEGCHLTGYYPLKMDVDMADIAKKNKVELNDDGSITLHGEEETLHKGSQVDLRAGSYTVTYRLSIAPSSAAEIDDVVCRLAIEYYNGDLELRSVSVTRGLFDKAGCFTAKVLIDAPDAENTEFCVYPEGSNIITVKNINCQKTPAVDIHRFYNDDKIKYREEYYDTDGTPYDLIYGYFAREIEFDSDNNLIHEIYYDSEQDRALVPDGYCEVRRYYDDQHHVLREEYYGTDGKRINLVQGFSAAEIKYDDEWRQKEVLYYDASDKPITVGGDTWGGYQRIVWEFDEQGRTSAEHFLDRNGDPVTLKEGYSYRTYEYDENGKQIRQRYFDAEGQPALTKEGYAYREPVFDEFTGKVKYCFYGPDGKLLHTQS